MSKKQNIGTLKMIDGVPTFDIKDKKILKMIERGELVPEIGYIEKKVEDGEAIEGELLEVSLVQSPMIDTPKTMLDWFAERGINHISVEVPFSREGYLSHVYAHIELDEATKRGKYSFQAIDDDGGVFFADDRDEISAHDASVFANHVKKLEAVLAEAYPITQTES